MLPAAVRTGHYLTGNCGAAPAREMLLARTTIHKEPIMTPHRILQLNALTTLAGAVGMLATRGSLYLLFGLRDPQLLDAIAVGLLAYGVMVGAASRRAALDRPTLMTFAIVDGLWVAGSAIVLMAFWGQFTPVARVLVIAVAIAVDVFATLQYRAARALAA